MVMIAHSVDIDNNYLAFLEVTLLNSPRFPEPVSCWAGMGTASLLMFSRSGKFRDIWSSYNKTTASQVNIDHSHLKTKLVLSLK